MPEEFPRLDALAAVAGRALLDAHQPVVGPVSRAEPREVPSDVEELARPAELERRLRVLLESTVLPPERQARWEQLVSQQVEEKQAVRRVEPQQARLSAPLVLQEVARLEMVVQRPA